MSAHASTAAGLPARLPLVGREPVGAGLVRVALDASEVAASYARAGQYVHLDLDGDAAYFALANAPGDSTWELVVRDSGGASKRLLELPLGSGIHVDPVLGAGFADSVVQSPTLLVVAVGSGVAVARAVLAARRSSPSSASGRASLYLGVRDADDVPFVDELVGTMADGATVVLCVSRRDAGPPGLTVRKGWVQAALGTDLEAGRVPLGCDVVAVGPDGLLTDLRDLERRGRVGTVHTNY